MQGGYTAHKRKMHEMLQEATTELPVTLEVDTEEPNCCDSLTSSCNVVVPVSKGMCVQKQLCTRQEKEESSNNLVPAIRFPKRQTDNLCLFFAAFNVLDVDKKYHSAKVIFVIQRELL